MKALLLLPVAAACVVIDLCFMVVTAAITTILIIPVALYNGWKYR